MDAESPHVSLLAPDHPLLHQAQEALAFQLEERKINLEEQFREKLQGLKVNKWLSYGV